MAGEPASTIVGYRQIDRRRGLAFVVLYLAALFVPLLLLVGLGGLADLVNRVAEDIGVKALGFGIGIVVLGPLFLMTRRLYPAMEARLGATEVGIGRAGRAPDRTIAYDDIGTMGLNESRPNTLDLRGQDGTLLYTFAPFNDLAAAPRISAFIARPVGFGQTKTTRKAFGGAREITLYVRSPGSLG